MDPRPMLYDYWSPNAPWNMGQRYQYIGPGMQEPGHPKVAEDSQMQDHSSVKVLNDEERG